MSSNEKTLPSILESFVIAFSMYSRIPMPFVEWSECGMKYAFCFFPLIGVVIGACVCAFCWLSVQAGLGILAFSLLGTAVPLLITGGIHMDGFLDVTDARSSFQSRERKLEILKDPSRRSLCHCRVRCLSAAVRGSLFRAASGGLSGHWRNLCDDTGPERSFGSLFPKGKKGWTGSYVCQRNRKRSTGSQSSAGSLASGGSCVCISGIRYRHGSGPDSGSSGSVSLVSSHGHA